MARPVTKDPDKVALIIRIRELLKVYGPNAVSRATGVSRSHVSNIKNGIRCQDVGAVMLKELQLRRTTKLCRRCGEACRLTTKLVMCVECTVLELAKQGLVDIKTEGQE